MFKHTLFLLTALLLGSCVSPTNSEKNAIAIVANHLNTQIEYSIGKLLSTEDGNGKFFEIKIDNTGEFEGMSLELLASNSILLFYANLEPSDRNNYEYYDFIVKNKSNETEFRYSQNMLENILSRVDDYGKIVEELKANELNQVFKKSLPEIIENIDKEETISWLKSQEEEYGKIKEHYIIGFYQGGEIKGQNTEWVDLIGVLIRENGNRKFDLKMSLEDDFTIYKIEME